MVGIIPALKQMSLELRDSVASVKSVGCTAAGRQKRREAGTWPTIYKSFYIEGRSW